MKADQSSMHRQVLLLATAQALFQTASVMVMAVGGLAGALVTAIHDWPRRRLRRCSSALQ